MSQDLDLILQQLLNMFQSQPDAWNAPVATTTSVTPSVKKQYNLPNDSFQNPLKVTYYNSGEFGQGDARHKGIHNGVDLRVAGGTPAYPITNGVVTSVSSQPKGGNVISIKHSGKLQTIYRHMGTVSVHPGQEVDKETVLGTVGDSGNAVGTAPHIHFEVKENGQYVNPRKYIYVPPYTNMSKEEQYWISSEHKQNARNFKVNEHLSRVASVDKLNKIADIFLNLSSNV